MISDKNPYSRESKSNGRRSSILKRQDSCFSSEGADGNTECPRTPRRVSFASTAHVRYLDISSSDDSCVSSNNRSDTTSTSSGSSQSMDRDSVFIEPYPPGPGSCVVELAVNTYLTEAAASVSAADRPSVLANTTHLAMVDNEMNPTHLAATALMSEEKTIYDTSAMSLDMSDEHTFPWHGEETNPKCVSETQRQDQNHTIIYAEADEYDSSMDLTVNKSQLSESFLQESKENLCSNIFSSKTHNKPGLNRRPSFTDGGSSEAGADQDIVRMYANTEKENVPDCTIIFSNKSGEEMELTQDVTIPVSGKSYVNERMNTSVDLKPKPKQLDDLFQLVKKQETNYVTACSTQKNPKQLDDLFQLVKRQEINYVTTCSTQKTLSLGVEDMELTSNISQVIFRTALSDITTHKPLSSVLVKQAEASDVIANKSSSPVLVNQAEISDITHKPLSPVFVGQAVASDIITNKPLLPNLVNQADLSYVTTYKSLSPVFLGQAGVSDITAYKPFSPVMVSQAGVSDITTHKPFSPVMVSQAGVSDITTHKPFSPVMGSQTRVSDITTHKPFSPVMGSQAGVSDITTHKPFSPVMVSQAGVSDITTHKPFSPVMVSQAGVSDITTHKPFSPVMGSQTGVSDITTHKPFSPVMVSQAGVSDITTHKPFSPVFVKQAEVSDITTHKALSPVMVSQAVVSDNTTHKPFSPVFVKQAEMSDIITHKPLSPVFASVMPGEGSFLSDLELVHNTDPILSEPINLQDLYETVGIPKLAAASMKPVCVQKLPTATSKEKLIAKTLGLPRLCLLKQHLNEIDAVINRCEQECTERLIQFSDKPPEILAALQAKENNVSDLKTKTQEMILSCRAVAQAMWKRHKINYLMKYSEAVEEECQTLDYHINEVVSSTEKTLDLTAVVDKCLQTVDLILEQKQGLTKQQKELREAEREVQQLKLQCQQIDDSVATCREVHKEAVKSLTNMDISRVNIQESLSWLSSFTEWSILKRMKGEIHFGFLFNTLVLAVNLTDCDSSYEKISRVNVHSRLSAESKPWAKLSHHLTVSNINCKKLQDSYTEYHQINQLLADVSVIVCDFRHFSTELKLAHLKHCLSIDDNSLKFTVSNRKTRQKITLSTAIIQNYHPHNPLMWTVTTLIGSALSQDVVKSAIDQLVKGPDYISRVLSQTEIILAQIKY